MNRCGYFAKDSEQKEDSPKVKEGDSVPKPKKKGAKNPRQAPKETPMIGMLPTPRVEWWEMLNWEEMKEVYENLPLNIKEKLKEKGLAPRG